MGLSARLPSAFLMVWEFIRSRPAFFSFVDFIVPSLQWGRNSRVDSKKTLKRTVRTNGGQARAHKRHHRHSFSERTSLRVILHIHIRVALSMCSQPVAAFSHTSRYWERIAF